MPKILFFELIKDLTAGTESFRRLGEEHFIDVEEALVPQVPQPNSPITITKKFKGRDEYRWRVVNVAPGKNGCIDNLEVVLEPQNQLLKSEYLSNILKGPGKQLKNVVHRFSIVEIDYGHPLAVFKSSGDTRTNKRYVDTVQSGSMPKRRLGIVNSVLSRPGVSVVQVVPISSKEPPPDDQTSFEVTSALAPFVHYPKRSWAICGMMESVSDRRIIAPHVRWSQFSVGRDTGFKHKLTPSLRPFFEEALLHAIGFSQLLQDRRELFAAKASAAEQEARLDGKEKQLNHLTEENAVLLEIAQDLANHRKVPIEELLEEYKATLSSLGG